jgi:4'-phosphopantetheinyl transferase EntD
MADFKSDEPFIHNHRQILISESINPIHLLEYRPEFYRIQLYCLFKIEKPAQISQWIPTRQAQFLAGRIAVRKALVFDKAPTLENQVSIGHSREPIWPENIIGSISHTGQTSIACVAEQTKTSAGLGIDIQETIAPELQSQISSTVLTHKDSLLFKQCFSNLKESVLFTLIFSAKESFFKAAFNSVGEYFEFTDVSIVNLDLERQQLTLKTNKHLSKSLPAGFETNISYISLESSTTQVITACYWEL